MKAIQLNNQILKSQYSYVNTIEKEENEQKVRKIKNWPKIWSVYQHSGNGFESKGIPKLCRGREENL